MSDVAPWFCARKPPSIARKPTYHNQLKRLKPQIPRAQFSAPNPPKTPPVRKTSKSRLFHVTPLFFS